MSHQIHHTEGFVISGNNYSEANRYLSIFTKDFGLVRANAQGLRKLASKLRFSLQDFSYSEIDLVRGKEIWRVTNAKKISSYEKLNSCSESLKFLANIFRLLKRFCHGEEANLELFDYLIEIYKFLENESLDAETFKNLECVSVLRILYHLGYIDKGENAQFITSPLSLLVLGKAGPIRRVLIEEINRAINESQL